jgi:hypothetical protein
MTLCLEASREAALELKQNQNLNIYVSIRTGLSESDTRSGQGDVEQLGLSCDDHATLASKLEVGRSGTCVDLADELARGVPDVDTVTAARVDAALGVGVDTFSDTLAPSHSKCLVSYIRWTHRRG